MALKPGLQMTGVLYKGYQNLYAKTHIIHSQMPIDSFIRINNFVYDCSIHPLSLHALVPMQVRPETEMHI